MASRRDRARRIGRGLLRAVTGVAIGIAAIATVVVLVKASPLLALAAVPFAFSLLAYGYGEFAEGVHDIQLGIQGVSDEEARAYNPVRDGLFDGCRQAQNTFLLYSLGMSLALMPLATLGPLVLSNVYFARRALTMHRDIYGLVARPNASGAAVIGLERVGTRTLSIPITLPRVNVGVIAGELTRALAVPMDIAQAFFASGGGGGAGGGSPENTPREVFNSIRESPNYPDGFTPRQNGTTKRPAHPEMQDFLRQFERGRWYKVYKDGWDATGNKISIHYFVSQSGKVFNVKVVSGWSN